MPKAVLDPTSICNMALWHLGQTNGLESFDDDATVAGDGCRLFYPQVVDEVLRAFPWPFATKFATPALVEGPDPAPTPEWAYSYRYPVDGILIRRILPAGSQAQPSAPGYPLLPGWPGSRIETQSSRIPYRIATDDVGLLIYTDFPPVDATDTTPALPMIEYIAQQDDTGFYEPKFSQALAFLLAFYLAPGLTGGDKFKLGERAKQNFIDTVLEAAADAKNEEQPDMLPDAEIIQARG